MSMPQHCPGCGNRCSLDSPSCSTGEAYLRSLQQARKKKQSAPAPIAPQASTPEQPAPVASPSLTEPSKAPRPEPRAKQTGPAPQTSAGTKSAAPARRRKTAVGQRTAAPRRAGAPRPSATSPQEVYASLSQEDKLAYQMRSLSRHMAQNQPREKSGQARILALLAQRGDLTQRQLLALAGIRSSSLSELLGKLESAGLVQRAVCPTDHRTTVVSLTDQGRQQAAQSQTDQLADPFRALDQQERRQLLSLLEKLNQAQP